MKKDFLTVTPDSGTGSSTVTVSASANTGVARSAALSIAGGGMTRTINISQAAYEGDEPSTAPYGVYIQRSNGKLFPKDKWKTAWNNEAVGIAVKTSKCSFVIAPEEQTSIQWGGHGTLINGCTTTTNTESTKIDYIGKQNTDAIIAKLGTSEQYAANYCQNYTFKNGKVGYLPAVGELFEAYQNKSEVDACMSLIGGKALYEGNANNRKWSSTQYGENTAWLLNWDRSDIYYLTKNNSFCARPFTTLI